MNILSIVFKNLRQRSLSSILTILSIMLGVALVVSILILRKESEEAFNQTATGYELIVGPKGSPLQLTLNTIYQIGVPVGNMPLSTFELLNNDKRVKLAIPYILGDNYKGFRLAGTTTEIFTEFEYKKGIKFSFNEGKAFYKDFEAVIGSEAAVKTGLKPGDTFVGSHGVDSYEGAESHEEHNFKVTGILDRTFTPTDKVIFVSMNSIWKIHEHPESENETDSVHTHKGHGANEESAKTITAVMLKLRNPLYFDLVRRQINDNKYEGISAQAVMPLFEIKQLFDIISNINSILLIISYIVILVAAVSIFMTLYNSVNERRRDIAIMRSLGAGKFTVLKIIILEGAFISLAGSVLGVLAGHLAVFIMKDKISEMAGIQITGTSFNINEIYILAGTFLLGILVSLLPALKAYRTEVARNLTPVS